MDAVKRYWQLLRALLLVRPLIGILLGLFYVVAALLALTMDSDKKGTAILVLSAIPTLGFFAIATERSIQYSMANAVLGIPRHAESLRNAQIALLFALIGVPAAIGIMHGGQPSYMALLCVPAALGVLLPLYARWAFLIWITIAVATRFSYSFGAWMPGLSNPLVRVTLILASMGVLYWWLGLATRTEQRVKRGSLLIADAKHESTHASAEESRGAPSGFKAYEQGIERKVAGVICGIDRKGITSRALGMALAVDLRPKWRAMAAMIGIGWVLLFVFLSIRRRQPEPTIYTGITVLAAVSLFTRLGVLRQAWKLRGAEEELLALSPRWPAQATVKRLFAELMLQSQTGTWIVWFLISLPAYCFRWIADDEAAIAILMMCAASCGACGSLLVALSRPQVKEISIITIALLLCCACGVLMYEFGMPIVRYPRIIGVSMIVGPLILGVLRFSFQPLQFPVRRVSRQ